MPRISVITVVRNAVDTISECIQSIQNQKAPVEHIIVDGASIDGTMERIKSFNCISRVVSEPDRGLYDAMNKAISLATGDVVGILNADDVYAGPDVLRKVQKIFENNSIDACYGDLFYVDSKDTEKIKRYWRSGSFHPDKFYWGWMPPHPTFFVRRSVYENYGLFNLDMGTAADYELMLRLLVKHRVSAVYLPEIIVRMRSGGASNAALANRLRANRMDRKAWEVNGLKPYPWTFLMKPLRKLPQYFRR